MIRPVESIRTWMPRLWSGEGGRAGTAARYGLAPLEAGFRMGLAARNLAYDRGWLPTERAPIPVISVGNLAVGGAGKTPFAAWLARRLGAAGRRPAIVLRGYGIDEIEVHRHLNPDVPVIAAPRRGPGVKAAADAGHDVAVLDDAFQHRSLARNLDIVLIATESWSSRRRLLPRGPWREPAESLRRADLIVVTRKTATGPSAISVAQECRGIARGVPVAICHLRPTHLTDPQGAARPLQWLTGRPVLAVASLADPVPFIQQLTDAGAVPELLRFPDHHAFDASDVLRIQAAAGGRDIVCTRKEAVKLIPITRGDLPLLILNQEVGLENGSEAVETALGRVFEH